MSFYLADKTYQELQVAKDTGQPLVALLPIGSVEPHGPHMTLDVDLVLSQTASERAAHALSTKGIAALIAPAIPYGVTECAAGFAGAVSVSAEALRMYVQSVVSGLLSQNFAHVCLVNNHLEPEHDATLRKAVEGYSNASLASPLDKVWARRLGEEFARGECHAGRYETSLMLASAPQKVREEKRNLLQEVPVSLSQNLRQGITGFADMGLTQAYAGNPAAATKQEGEDLLTVLAEMIVTSVATNLG